MKQFFIDYITGFGSHCLFSTMAASKREALAHFRENFPYYTPSRITLQD